MKEQNNNMDYMGQFAIAHIITHVFCICIAYWGLNAIRLDQFFKKGFPMQVQVIMIFAAIFFLKGFFLPSHKKIL